MITFNVRSLIEVNRKLDLFNILKYNGIDVAFIQETHLRKNQNLNLEGYCFFKDSSPQGVGIMIRSIYDCSRVVIPGIVFPYLLLNVKILVNNIPKNFLFGSIYLPCNFNQSQIYNGLSILASLHQSYDGVFFGGDFNAKNIVWGDSSNNSNGVVFFNWLQHYSLDFVRICNTFPSFPNGSSFLDHFLLSTNLIDSSYPNYKIQSLSTFSDHFPLKLDIHLQNFDFILKPPLTFVSFKNTNWQKFKNEIILGLSNHFPSSHRNLSNLEIDEYVDEFSTTIDFISNINSEKINLNNRKFIMSDNIKNLFKIKYNWQKNLKKIYRRTLNRLNPEYTLLSKQIHLLTIIIKRQLEIEQAHLFSEKIKNIRPGPNAHKNLYKIVGYKKNKFINKLSLNGVPLISDVDKLTNLKDHFSKIYSASNPQRDVSHIDSLINEIISSVSDYVFDFNSNFSALNTQNCNKLVTLDELLDHSKNINNKKSCGFDNISNFIIRKLPCKAFEYLTIIFNHCINNSYFPNVWKLSKIIPIQKKPHNTDIDNLRPISLLSNVGKLFEGVLRIKMDTGVIIPYIPDLQFGFKKGHSTTDALLKFQNDVVSHLRIKHCTVAVSLDVEKAFDHAYHNGILFKMIRIGFDPSFIKLFRSFFSDRKFSVQFNRLFSDFGNVNCGVPQGSILAPHLYNIFMYDFPHIGSNCISLLYADDSLVYSHHESPILALNQVSEHLKTVKKFYDDWAVKINLSKCEAICLRNASSKCKRFVVPESKQLRLYIDNIEIPFKDNIKYLGVNFNKLLKFNKHARLVLAKSYKILGSFAKILCNKSLPVKTKLLLYKTSLRPVFLYAFPIWFNVSPIVIKELEIFERKVLRNCIGKYFESFCKRYSNVYIYKESNVTPIGLYVCDIIRRFISRSSCHENKFVSDIFEHQKNFSWSNINYLSPFGYMNETTPSFDLSTCLRHEFYSKSVQGTHRG